MLTVFAAAAESGSKTAFYVAAGALALWAVAIGVIGITQPEFPRGAGGARLVMLVSGLLMATTMAMAVVVSS